MVSWYHLKGVESSFVGSFTWVRRALKADVYGFQACLFVIAKPECLHVQDCCLYNRDTVLPTVRATQGHDRHRIMGSCQDARGSMQCNNSTRLCHKDKYFREKASLAYRQEVPKQLLWHVGLAQECTHK